MVEIVGLIGPIIDEEPSNPFLDLSKVLVNGLVLRLEFCDDMLMTEKLFEYFLGRIELYTSNHGIMQTFYRLPSTAQHFFF